MDSSTIRDALDDIEATPDLLDRALKLAGLVTALFEEAGCPLVVVGGSAVEFYTEGSYLSGDIDLCRLGGQPIPLRKKQELLGLLGATGGPRSWKVGSLFVDILGELENEARAPLREVRTPRGVIRLIPPELLIVERVLTAVYPRPDEGERTCALMLLSSAVSGKIPVDWSEVERLARLPDYAVLDELASLTKEARDAQCR